VYAGNDDVGKDTSVGKQSRRVVFTMVGRASDSVDTGDLHLPNLDGHTGVQVISPGPKGAIRIVN